MPIKRRRRRKIALDELLVIFLVIGSAALIGLLVGTQVAVLLWGG